MSSTSGIVCSRVVIVLHGNQNLTERKRRDHEFGNAMQIMHQTLRKGNRPPEPPQLEADVSDVFNQNNCFLSCR